MSVYKRKNCPTFSYDFQRGGRRFSGDTGCTTKREAEAVERTRIEDAKRELAQGHAAIKALTLNYVMGRYWTETGQHHAGADNTERDLKRLLEYFGESVTLTAITDDDVAKLVAWRRGHRLPGKGRQRERPTISSATVNRSTTEVLKKLFTYAKDVLRAHFDAEPVWRKHMLEEPQERVRELRDDEAARLNAAMRDDYAPFFAFLHGSGVRRNEALTLRWSEVDFALGLISKPGKGAKKIVVPITSALRDILFPLQGHDGEYVFTYVAERTQKERRRGDAIIQPATVAGARYPLTVEGVKTRWRRLRQAAGVDGFRLHDYRHDFGTKLLRATGNLKLVSKALNHARIETTSRYAHVADSEVAAAIEAMQAQRCRERDQNSHQKSHGRFLRTLKGES